MGRSDNGHSPNGNTTKAPTRPVAQPIKHPWRSLNNGARRDAFSTSIKNYIRERERTHDTTQPDCIRCNFKAGVVSYCVKCAKPRTMTGVVYDNPPRDRVEIDPERLLAGLKMLCAVD